MSNLANLNRFNKTKRY